MMMMMIQLQQRADVTFDGDCGEDKSDEANSVDKSDQDGDDDHKTSLLAIIPNNTKWY